MTYQGDIFLVQDRQFLPRSYTQLPFNKVLPSDHLSHWVLHLQSGVHFHEVELICNSIENKFDCASIDITNSFGSLDSSVTNLFSNFLTDLRGCLFNDLLVTSLY